MNLRITFFLLLALGPFSSADAACTIGGALRALINYPIEKLASLKSDAGSAGSSLASVKQISLKGVDLRQVNQSFVGELEGKPIRLMSVLYDDADAVANAMVKLSEMQSAPPVFGLLKDKKLVLSNENPLLTEARKFRWTPETLKNAEESAADIERLIPANYDPEVRVRENGRFFIDDLAFGTGQNRFKAALAQARDEARLSAKVLTHPGLRRARELGVRKPGVYTRFGATPESNLNELEALKYRAIKASTEQVELPSSYGERLYKVGTDEGFGGKNNRALYRGELPNGREVFGKATRVDKFQNELKWMKQLSDAKLAPHFYGTVMKKGLPVFVSQYISGRVMKAPWDITAEEKSRINHRTLSDLRRIRKYFVDHRIYAGDFQFLIDSKGRAFVIDFSAFDQANIIEKVGNPMLNDWIKSLEQSLGSAPAK